VAGGRWPCGGHDFPLPHAKAGLLQVAVSCANWMLMGGALWFLTRQQAPYAAALATVLLGAIAGLVSRIPAGLGVLEAVATARALGLHARPPKPWPPCWAYRMLYFFAPLGGGGAGPSGATGAVLEAGGPPVNLHREGARAHTPGAQEAYSTASRCV
jgi:Predicted integral membrane protein